MYLFVQFFYIDMLTNSIYQADCIKTYVFQSTYPHPFSPPPKKKKIFQILCQLENVVAMGIKKIGEAVSLTSVH